MPHANYSTDAAFFTEPTPDRTAFELGWDYAHYRLTPPADHLHEGHPVRQGWDAGRAVFGTRTLLATASVRKWLQLRLNAWLRGKSFEGVQVTPRFLARIEVTDCPITGEPLTHATGTPSDASVDRVNNDAGYAAGNLAVMSVRANQAKSLYDWRDAAGFARQIETGRLGQIDGLEARHWARLASLMSLCTPLTHAEAANIPLLVLPPPRLRVLNPVQALQVVLTLRFTRRGQAANLDQVACLFPPALRTDLRVFMTTLLARRVGAGPTQDAGALRLAMEAAWSHPIVLRCWRRLAMQLTPAQCEAIVGQAVARRLAGNDLRCLTQAQATDGWALEHKGLVPQATRADGDAAAALPPRPRAATIGAPVTGQAPVQAALVFA